MQDYAGSMNKYMRKATPLFIASMAALVAATLAIAALPAAAGTYKWVDENGKVHYSDKPVEGAEEVKLPELPTYDTPKVPERKPVDEEGLENEPKAFSYREVGFISPKHEQVFWNTGGKVPIQLDVQPALRPGDQVKVFVDGELRAGPGSSLGFTLDEMYRGTYSIRAVIENPDGEQLAAAGPVTFFVKQTSIQN